MTAIILAAGVGKRMGAGAGPKCLMPIGGKSLLRRTLETLRAIGVKEVALVTGFQGEAVAQEARAHARPMKLTVLLNPRYTEGAILSLWTAKEFLDRPVLIMDADVLCPQAAFERLAGSLHENCLLADGSVSDTGEEQMVFGREGRVFHIAKKAADSVRREMEWYGESLGFLRVGRQAALTLRNLLEQKVQTGETGIEHEQVYPDLFRQVKVGCERVDGLAWTEIDTPEDLSRAEREVFSSWSDTPCVNRVISGWFHPLVLKMPLTPNQWTFISLLLGLASLYYVALGTFAGSLWGAALFQLYYIVDNWDGEVARVKGLSSKWGGWFDVVVDGVIQIPLPLALAAGLRNTGAAVAAFPLAWIASLGIGLSFLVTGWAKVRGFGPSIPGDPARSGPAAGVSGWRRWLKVNSTNENFSWIVVAALLLQARMPFLVLLAAGSQVFWIRFLLQSRRRLAAC